MESCLVGSPIVLAPRPTANFQPSLWDETFLSNATKDGSCEGSEKAETLKREVLKMLSEDEEGDLPNNSKLHLIDAIQRLGIAYHFEEEIEKELERNFSYVHDNEDDLNATALRFRLLREHGYNVSSDVFKKFVDTESNFNKSLSDDVDGLLGLYEATHLSVKGETILEDALRFTTISLRSLLPKLNPFISKQVNDALYRPLHKRLPRLEARNYFSIYEQKEQHSEVLLQFAKLDFNILQKLHQNELRSILEWWKEVDCATNYPFARNRIVELFFWILGAYFEPEYAASRKFLTQVIATTSIIDDIYDVYGTKEELELFTDVVDKWEVTATVNLPKCMKTCHEQLLDIFGKAEEEMMKQGRPTCGVQCAKEAMKRLVKAYFEEKKLSSKEDEIPTMEEYLKIALVSSAYPMLSTASLVWMGGVVENKLVCDWMLSQPKVLTAASIVCRLMEDIVSHKFEQEREHSPSAVECYTRQYGVGEKTACDVFRLEVEEAWKDINEVFLRPMPVANSVLMRVLNLVRVIETLYKEGDGYTHVTPTIKDIIASILFIAVQV